MDVGLRVVRGPDWKWQNEDGGEGHVGTVVEIVRNVNSNASEKTVVVQWDSGSRTRCRVGHQNECFLLVWDSSPTGLNHQYICDSCDHEQNHSIFGTRWNCRECPYYDLCHSCYMSGKHDLSHSFYRCDNMAAAAKVAVSNRCNVTQREVKGIFPGATVVRGPDWESGDEDGGPFNLGKVLNIQDFDNESRRSMAVVMWDSGLIRAYRLGHKGKVDLKCVTAASGGLCYWDHLLPLGPMHIWGERRHVHKVPFVRETWRSFNTITSFIRRPIHCSCIWIMLFSLARQ